jgi:hypothetical protein
MWLVLFGPVPPGGANLSSLNRLIVGSLGITSTGATTSNLAFLICAFACRFPRLRLRNQLASVGIQI